MYTVILIIFCAVLVIDFMAAVDSQKVDVVEIIVRGFMVVAFAWLMKNVG